MSTMFSPRLLASALVGAIVPLCACAFEFADTPVRPHGSAGAETFRVLCMNLAAQAFPDDLTGRRFSGRCAGQLEQGTADPPPLGEEEQRAYLRFDALLSHRAKLVSALDRTFDEASYQRDELRDFLAGMVPFYDPPEQLPALTRAAAALLQQLIDPNDAVGAEAVSALERVSVRDGYRPARFGLALTRAVLGYPKLDAALRSTLDAIAKDTGPAHEAYEELLRAAALDLATAEQGMADPKQPGSLALSVQLMLQEDDAYAGDGAPSYLTRRDQRGMARPNLQGGVLPAPFQDSDKDGMADTNQTGRFLFTGGSAASPYRLFDERQSMTPRDTSGRALDGQGQTLYESLNVDRTLLAGLLRDLAPLLAHTREAPAPLLDFLHGMNGLLGDYGPRVHAAGQAKLSYQGPDVAKGPLFDFAHGLASVLPFEQTVPLLNVLEQLVGEHENEVAGLVEAMLYIKERADAHPDATWQKPHELWDDLIAWATRVAGTPGLMERVLRSLTDEQTAKLGPLIGNFMRFRDRVNYPLGKPEELAALGIDNQRVLGRLGKDCTGPDCGRACDMTNRCPGELACVVKTARSDKGTCGSVVAAVAAHRINVNYPCANPATDLLGSDPGAGCKPRAPYPAPHHRGIRGCPATKPQEGAACSAAGGVGLCSWDEGSCTCDCEGGLCRHGAKPTWRCTGTPTPGYADWVERSEPDNRVSAQGSTNQSLFQRTIALVHDLHVPASMCNKADARVVLYAPAGSNDPLIPAGFNPLMEALLGKLLGPYPACGMLKEDQIVRYYLRSVLGYGGVKIQDAALRDMMDNLLPSLGMDGDALMERQYQIRGFNLANPTPEGIARMVFSPYNAFEDGVQELVKSRDKTPVTELHQDTIMAWELKDPIGGASYLDALVPLLKALDPNGEKDDGFIGMYADVFSVLHKHWSSRQSDATHRDCDDSTRPPTCNEQARLFAYQSNGVSYEELVAEAMLDAGILSRVRELMVALDGIVLPGGKDGIAVFSEVVQNLLLPTRSCLGQDCAASPLSYRDGKASSLTNTGKTVAQVAPIYLLLDALNAIDARFEGAHATRLGPWRNARSRLVDVFFDVDRSAPGRWHFKNPRGRAALLDVLGFVRERVASHEREQQECAARGGSGAECRQLRDWAFGLVPRLEASLGQPVSAAALRLLDRLRELDSDPAGQLAGLLAHLTSESAPAQTFAATALGTADLLQVLVDTRNVGPLMRFGARAVANNASQYAAGSATQLDVQTGAVEKALSLTRSLLTLVPDGAPERSTLGSLLARLAEPDMAGETPLDTILDTIVAVNRAVPGRPGDEALEAKDLRALLDETGQFMRSERHGLERLYKVIQSRELP